MNLVCVIVKHNTNLLKARSSQTAAMLLWCLGKLLTTHSLAAFLVLLCPATLRANEPPCCQQPCCSLGRPASACKSAQAGKPLSYSFPPMTSLCALFFFYKISLLLVLSFKQLPVLHTTILFQSCLLSKGQFSHLFLFFLRGEVILYFNFSFRRIPQC